MTETRVYRVPSACCTRSSQDHDQHHCWPKRPNNLYARVTTFQLPPGTTEPGNPDASGYYRAAARQQQGFIGVSGKDQSMTVTLWQTKANMKAVEASGTSQHQMGKVASLVAAPSSREVCEVSVQA